MRKLVNGFGLVLAGSQVRPDGLVGRGSPRSNSVGSVTIQGAQRLARLAVIAIAAYSLQPAQFASLALALALADLGRSALVGLDVGAIRALTHRDAPADVLAARVIAKVAIGSVLAVITVAIAFAAYGIGAGALAGILAIGLVPSGLATLWLTPRQVNLQLLPVAPRVVLVSIGTVVAASAAGAQADERLIAASLVAGDVALCILLFDIPVRSLRFSKPSVLATIAEAPRLMLMQLAYMGEFRIGILILGAMSTPLAVAEYTVGARVAEGVVILSTAMVATTYPLLSHALASGNRAGLKCDFLADYWRAVGLSVAVLAPLVVTAPIWLAIVFPRYPGAAVPFALVALSVTFFFASGQTTSLLNAARRDGYAAGTASAGFGTTAIASLLVAPVGGAAGVALARAAGELSRLALEMIGVARTGLVETRRVLAVWGTVAPVMIGAGLAVVSGWDIVWTAAGIVIGALGGVVAGRAVLRRMGVELSRDGLST